MSEKKVKHLTPNFWVNAYHHYDTLRQEYVNSLKERDEKMTNDDIKQINEYIEKIRWTKFRAFKAHQREEERKSRVIERFQIAGTHIYDAEDLDWVVQVSSYRIAKLITEKLNAVHNE